MGIKQRIKKKLVKKEIHTVQTALCEGNYLSGKNALIIGGAGGIGSGIAKRFAENGCKLVISGTNEGRLKQTCKEIGNFSEYVVIDVKSIENIKTGITKAIEILGKIDILVYSAGVHGNEKFGNVSESTYDDVMSVNLKALFFSCQFISDYMIQNGIKGHILTISSASCAKPAWTPYEISKWGVRGFTLGLADMLIPYGIIVNSIAPGPVATRMINKDNTSDYSMPVNPSGRMATVEEIANLAVFMASSAGDMIVGDTYFISGGSGTTKMHNA